MSIAGRTKLSYKKQGLPSEGSPLKRPPDVIQRYELFIEKQNGDTFNKKKTRRQT